MNEDGPNTAEGIESTAGLKPHEDARAIVRLFQCQQCSYPLREPMTLPCGNTLCRPCVPPLYARENITYPQNADRVQGFACPFSSCGMEHSLADCSLDVTLNKMIEIIKGQVAVWTASSAGGPLKLDERLDWQSVIDSSIDVMPRSRVLSGGRIVSAYTFAADGELNYQSELSFTPLEGELTDETKAIDVAVADTLKDIIRAEFECHVCYGLMLDPLTTACGHTFCRKCVARVLDHSNLCPACRRPLPMRPGVSTEPSNKRISWIAQGLLADELAARLIAAQQEDNAMDEGWLPLFPCTLAFPLMPTFLHIFEPRYRLMIRRCMENGSLKFGMMMYNSTGESQGSLGQSTFMQYGTALHIERLEMFPDGRSLLETQGLYRFKVLESQMLDGYHIGRVQRIDDLPLAEEEAVEALETGREVGPTVDLEDPDARIDRMSTQGLLQLGIDFVNLARSRSAPWLHERVLAAYGQPPTDPAIFPYWFASILPMQEDQKYLLLPTASVRERLKMTARWIRILEERRCAHLALLSRLAGRNMGNQDAQNNSETSQQSAESDEESFEIIENPAQPESTEETSHTEAPPQPEQHAEASAQSEPQAETPLPSEPHTENDSTQN